MWESLQNIHEHSVIQHNMSLESGHVNDMYEAQAAPHAVFHEVTVFME